MADTAIKKIDKYQFSFAQLIGSGSYANVYKGEDRETGRAVAIKMIDRKKISAVDYLMNGLLQEIQIMKKLDSEYIVKLIDVLETKNNYYIIQEYCDLGDFRHYIKEKGIIAESEAKEVLVDILNGFLELLKHGVIHRDLKPENILISTNPKRPGQRIFKLADFGFSRTVDNFRRQLLKSLVGTPMYMSPQILMYQKYTSKSDIWSIGLILYEMLYGQMPWEAHSQYQLVEMIKTQPIKYVTESQQELSEDAINFIYKCLQVEEVKRIQWDDMYTHSLLAGSFAHVFEKHKNLEDKALYLINNLRQKIHSTDTDLLDLFSHFDLTNDSKLDVKEFEQLMKQIDKELNREEIEYIFNKFDSDGDNKIDFTEFQKWLEKNNVRLQMNNSQHNNQQIITEKLNEEVKIMLSQQQMQVKAIQKTTSEIKPADSTASTSASLHSQQQRVLSVEENAIFAIGKLRLMIDQYAINIRELFDRYDKGQNDGLNVQEFGRMIRKIDEKLTQEEIAIAFKKFDLDGADRISFIKFQATLAAISNSVVIQIKQKNNQKGSDLA